MRKVTLAKTPEYINHIFPHTPCLYDGQKNELLVPRPRIDLVKSSISYSGARLWNAIPTSIRLYKNIVNFKARLQAYLQKPDEATRMVVYTTLYK